MKTDTSAIQVLADLLAGVARGVAAALSILLPLALRGVVAFVTIHAVSGTILATAEAYGGDFVAFLPAAAISLAPIMATLSLADWQGDEVWGRLLAGATMTYGLGWIVARSTVILGLLPPALLAMSVIALIGGDREQEIG